MAADTTAAPTSLATAGTGRDPRPTDQPVLPRHLPALDGIRGLAVVVVVLFHLGHLGVPGGWLGVDVFFALSGFLITTLLLAERDRTGRISLRRFWQRRARRLAPALVVLLVVICALSFLRDPGRQKHAVGRDTLWTLGYLVNWVQAIGQSGDAVAPELRHLWSLGVEEQVYVIWPPLVMLLVSWRFSARRLGLFAAVGALGSAAAMLAMEQSGVALDRLYYGSDTHLQTVLAGAALAAALHTAGGEQRARWSRRAQPVGWGALAVLTYATLHASSLDRALYRGGFLLLAIAMCAVLAAVTLGPTRRLARALAGEPLGWLGRRSYGIYLWHWPMICWFTLADTGLSRGPLAIVRVAATLAAAELSHRAIEAPIRTRGFSAQPWPVRAAGLAAAVGGTAGAVALMLAN
jgi:peptidoglycan/LPS O-acetylase OafA/YrhL